MTFENWNICCYDVALKKMNEIVQKRIEDLIFDTVIFTEHYPVITFGKTSKSDSLLVSKQLLESQGINCYETSRGGDITYHGPGQLIIYPIVKLKQGCRDIHKILRILEQIIIESCRYFKIDLQTLAGLTGVWKIFENQPPKKLASIGLGFKKWVSYHGIGLNVSTNLKNFDYMKPCGLSNISMENLENLTKQKISMIELIEQIKINFKLLENYLNK